jgi:ABC-type polysaccharide/polyol phosphate export permease
MRSPSRREINLGWRDIAEGLRLWPVWHLLATQEVRQRYRRSTLGPFWSTITVGVQVAAMGYLMGLLFGSLPGRYVPYLATGWVMWGFWTTAVTDGTSCFISAGGIMVHVKRPLSAYLLQTLWRNVIDLAHTSLVIVVVFVIFGVAPTTNMLWILISLPLVLINLAWISLFVGVVSARFRDVPIIVQSIFTLLFWATPIIYSPEQLGNKRFIADANPMTHLIDVVRQPLLGNAPSDLDWIIVIAMAVAGWAITFLFFARFRARVPYWL